MAPLMFVRWPNTWTWSARARGSWFHRTKKFARPSWIGCANSFSEKADRRRWKKRCASIGRIFRGRTETEEITMRPQEGNVATINANVQFIGEVTQISGVAAVVAGVVLSLHHWPAAVALVGGGVAFYVGKKLRGQ